MWVLAKGGSVGGVVGVRLCVWVPVGPYLLAGGGRAWGLGDRRSGAGGVQDGTVRTYPEAGHELLNETSREEVTADILAFLSRTVDG